MGVLDKFASSFVDVVINIPPPIKEENIHTIPKIVLGDDRISLPTETEKAYIDELMVAHNVDEYRRSKAEVILLPQVNIEISKILDIDVKKLKTLKIDKIK